MGNEGQTQTKEKESLEAVKEDKEAEEEEEESEEGLSEMEIIARRKEKEAKVMKEKVNATMKLLEERKAKLRMTERTIQTKMEEMEKMEKLIHSKERKETEKEVNLDKMNETAIKKHSVMFETKVL